MTPALRNLIKLLAAIAVQNYFEEQKQAEKNSSCEGRNRCSTMNDKYK